MSKHLTPDEVADAIGMRPDRLVGFSIGQFIPVSEGRVDTTLVLTRLEGYGHRLPGGTEDLPAPRGAGRGRPGPDPAKARRGCR